MKILMSFITTTLFLGAFQAHASLALRGKDFSEKAAHRSHSNYKGKEVNFQRDYVKGRDGITSKDLAQIVPYHLRATSDGDLVKEELFKKTASTFLKSSIIQESFLGKTVKKAQKATKVDMEIKEAPTVATEKPIEHKFDFQVDALKGEAKINYHGFVDSKIIYDHDVAGLNVYLEDKLSENSKIALSHQRHPEGSRQMVNFEMNW